MCHIKWIMTLNGQEWSACVNFLVYFSWTKLSGTTLYLFKAVDMCVSFTRVFKFYQLTNVTRNKLQIKKTPYQTYSSLIIKNPQVSKKIERTLKSQK